MSGKSSRGLIGGVVALGLVGSGSAFGYRTRRVAQRREEISALQREADQRVAEATERTRRAEAAFLNAKRVADEAQLVATTIWEDRRARYAKAVGDMQSYLVAAPESVGVLQGIIHHSKFLESVLPSFIRYDARAHQVSSMLLELTHGRSAGIRRVAPDLVKYHGYDPFIRTVGEHATSCIGTEDAPRNIEEVSNSFAYCHKTLERAIDEAQSSLVTDYTVVPPSPSLATQALSAVLGGLKATWRDPSELSDDAMAKLVRHQSDLRVLQTHADVRAALAYTDKLVSTYGELVKTAKSSGEPSPLIDQKVSEALSQFTVWRGSVLTFLLQEQAQRALDSYSLCVADTMTQLVHDGLPSKDAHVQ